MTAVRGPVEIPADHSQMRCAEELEIIPGATHLFKEPGTLEATA